MSSALAIAKTMEKLLRDTLRSQLRKLEASGDLVTDRDGPCLCYRFMINFSEGRREFSEWLNACHLVERHKCLCYITEDNPLFADLIAGCKSTAWNHDCICSQIVVPSCTAEDCSVINGYLLCRSQKHGCICLKVESSVCKAKNHACSCRKRKSKCLATDRHDDRWRPL
jgi:hypothetical protein